MIWCSTFWPKHHHHHGYYEIFLQMICESPPNKVTCHFFCRQPLKEKSWSWKFQSQNIWFTTVKHRCWSCSKESNKSSWVSTVLSSLMMDVVHWWSKMHFRSCCCSCSMILTFDSLEFLIHFDMPSSCHRQSPFNMISIIKALYNNKGFICLLNHSVRFLKPSPLGF